SPGGDVDRYVINELRQIKVVDWHNRSIVELVTYGDRQDPLIFEYFMEYQVLAEFVRVLKISKNSRIEAPLLQAVSNKLNKDTVCLLLKVYGDSVVSFPLYNEALKFAHHGEKMIQTAIRALTLSIYNVSDDMVYQYITSAPVSKMRTNQKRKELLLETDKIVDDLYYFNDMLGVGQSRLSTVVIENLLRMLIFPILLPLLQLGQSNGSNLSAVTSFYTVSRLLQVIGGKGMFNSVAGVILYPYMTSSVRDAIERDSTESISHAKSILSEMGKVVSSSPETEGAENSSLPRDTASNKRSGILAHKQKAVDGNIGNLLVKYMDQSSYQQSRECLQKELDGCWFDHIPEVLRNEWPNCKAELDDSQQATDGDATSYFAWKRMVETVKEPLLNMSSTIADSSKTHASDIASASFGSEVSLRSGIPCTIAFSNAGIRDIYLIPKARETTGKVLLAEKHPFRSQRGVVLAIGPLAGLNPKVDEDHPTWLHLQIREFEPKLHKIKVGHQSSGMSNHVADGRWTLGFSNANACEAARLSILEEIRKQRSSVESILAPLLQDSYPGNLSETESQDE
ncbi:hypothetical protein Prudu_019556, partial [Prunus dulcis]